MSGAQPGARWSEGTEAERAGHRASARGHFLRAAAYYATALYLIDHSSEPGRRLDIWRRQRDCWNRAVELFPVPGERIAIPYEGTKLAAYFFRAPDAATGSRVRWS